MVLRASFGVLCISLLPCNEHVLAFNQNGGKASGCDLTGKGEPEGDPGRKGGGTLSSANSSEAMDSTSKKRSDSAWAAWRFCWF